MIDFIPLEYYKHVWYNLLFLIAIIVYMQSQQMELTYTKNLVSKRNIGYFLLAFSILFIGLRPISGKYFTDMRTYAQVFEAYQLGEAVRVDKDIYFEYFMKISSQIMSVAMFFLVCAIVYIYPVYLASRRLFKEYWFYAFFIVEASFTFYGAGVNGIRNGMATSIMLLAFTFTDRKVIMAALFFIAVSCHKSMMLPVAAFVCSFIYRDSQKYLIFWLVCIPVSFVAGSAFEAFFTSSGIFDDSRLSYINSEDGVEDFMASGFRWDFITYSATGVFAGWFFIFKKKYKDVLYEHLFNVYLIANGFWILVMRASFSNRFAYLSWFMLGFLIIYPFLKVKILENQHRILGIVILLYFIFTYVMNVIIS